MAIAGTKIADPAASASAKRTERPRGEEGDDTRAEHEASEEDGARLVSHHRATHGIDALCPEQAPEARVADDLRAVAPADAVEDPVRRDHAGEAREHDVGQPQQARLRERAGPEEGEVLGKRKPDAARDKHDEENDDGGVPGQTIPGARPVFGRCAPSALPMSRDPVGQA